MNLTTPISKLPKVGPVYQRRLEKLNIETIGDLLFHAPHKYLDYRKNSKISELKTGDTLSVVGKVDFIRNLYSKSGKRMQLGQISDNTGSIKIVWFNQPYLVRMIRKGDRLSVAGELGSFGQSAAFISPEFEKLKKGKKSVHTGRLVPVYPETKGVSSKWLRGRVEKAFYLTKDSLFEYLPASIINEYSLTGYEAAFKFIHFPENLKEVKKGRNRLAFDELLAMQIKNQYKKIDWNKNETRVEINIKKDTLKRFSNVLPFKLTKSQEVSIQEILHDMKEDKPMNRLLEGDVGSGKTVVAAASCFAAFTNGHQSVIMAPTQILAQQHFETLNMIFSEFKIRIKLITANDTKGDLGKIDIFIGTHALIHRKVDFDNVALVVIDEQHRFGVEQRGHLVDKSKNKSFAPHVLTMTATPIPRSVALTVYGDLDLSVLKDMPKGRKKIKTWVVPPQKRGGAYNWIKKKVKNDNIQVFIICPLIEESQAETMSEVKSATNEYERLKKVFTKLKLGLLHGRQKAEEKNVTLDKFKKGEIDILVSTPVVEVGIDVPNATIMLIEGADRFGLAQLHQLRGRVGRGEKESYCLLFTESRSQSVRTRLKALQSTMSGFELAELDMKLRGPGEMLGFKQHGYPQLKIASWDNTTLIKKAKTAAEIIINNEKYLKKFKELYDIDKVILN
jgi:ATP-dependent DNA helicase RecG